MQERYSPKTLAYRLKSISWMLFTICITSVICVAQIDRAAFTGTVTDATGAVIQHAQVQVVDLATGLKSEAQTNSKGAYLVPGLAVGTYAVSISHEGFGMVSFQNVLLEVGLTRVLNAALRVSIPGEKVQVEASQPLEQTSPEVSGVINEQQIKEIPINGRDWATLLVLAPGAIDDGGGDQRTIRFAGRGRDDNNYMIDGVDATGIQEQAQKSTTRLQISEDAISEYRVSSALYSAEYGAGAGGQVDIETKSGTNAYHGSVYEYFRNNVLDARSFIDFDPFGNPVRPPFRMNQYGFTLGGPIKRGKTFFFLSYEGLRQLEDFTQAGFVPSAPLRAAVLAKSPQLAAIISAYPKGNTNFGVCTDPRSDPCADEFRHESPNVVNEDSFLVRLDHQISANTTFYARAQRNVSFSKAPLGAPNALLDTQQVITHPANYMLALAHTLSPTLFNEFKFGVNRAPFHNPQASVLPYDVTLDSGQFTELFNNNTDNEVGTTLGWIDNLSLTRGRNTFKMGIEIRRVRLNQGITADNNYTFPDASGLINGQLSSIAFRASWCCHGLRHTFVLPYFQDEWKVRPNITLNLGIRWEYYSVITEAHDRMTIFDPTCSGGVLPGTNMPVPDICPKGSPAYFPSYRNFDPRVGISCDPTRFHDKTVVHAGFGIYHGAGQNDDLNASLESDTTRINVTNVEDPTLAYPVDPTQFAADQFLSPRALARHRHDLYVEDWGLSVQQLLPKEFTFQAGYLGTHGVRLFARNFINQCEQFDPVPTCTRPFPNFGEIDIKRDAGTSHFDALQMSLQRNLPKTGC